jgi:hypothetical protein
MEIAALTSHRNSCAATWQQREFGRIRRSITTYGHNYDKGLADPIPHDGVYRDGACESIGHNPLSHGLSLFMLFQSLQR